MGDKIKIRCNGCGIYQEFDNFVRGESACPKCGLVSLFDKEKEVEPESPPVPLVDKVYKVCNACSVWWEEKEIKSCPKCGGTAIHGEVVKA